MPDLQARRKIGWRGLALALLAALLLFAGLRACGAILDDLAGLETTAPAPAGPAPWENAEHAASFRAKARSIQTSAVVTGLSKVTLEGRMTWQFFNVTVVDPQGRRHESASLTLTAGTRTVVGNLPRERPGRISASGANLEFWPLSMTLPARGPVELDPSQARRLEAATITGAGIPIPRDGVSFAAERLRLSSNLLSASTVVAGPVLVLPPAEGEYEQTLRVDSEAPTPRWVDPPSSIHLVDKDFLTSLSWAGSGSISIGGAKPRSADHVGFNISELAATVERGARGMSLEGLGNVHQLFLEGTPVLATKAAVKVILSFPLVIRPGERDTFAWAPGNAGPFQLCMTEIVALSEAAHWVNLALDPMPPMAGGEKLPAVGGRVIGFNRSGTTPLYASAQPIRSVLRIEEADQRMLTFDVPLSTPPGTYTIVIEIRGNFPAVRAEIPVEVKP